MNGIQHLPRAIVLSLALVVLAAAGFAYAQDSTARPAAQTPLSREAFHARAMQIRAQHMATGTPALQATRAIPAGTETRLRVVIENAQTRLARAIAHVEETAVRISAHADAYAAQGIDTAAVETLIADAHVSLDRANAILTTELAAQVETALAAEDPQAAFAYVKESLRAAASHIRSAQVTLREAVTILKTLN